MDTPRDTKDPRRVVCIPIDGMGHDVLQRLLENGEVRRIARWVIEPGRIIAGGPCFGGVLENGLRAARDR